MATDYIPPDVALGIPLTVRDRIIGQLLQNLANMPNDIAPDRAYAGHDLFSQVVTGDTIDVPANLWPCCGIIEGEEEVIHYTFEYMDRSLRVSFEFRWKTPVGVDNHTMYRYYLAKLQHVLMKDEYAYKLITPEYPTGMIMNLSEENNFPQIEAVDETAPSGVLNITISYRHAFGDPYKFHPFDQ